MDFKNFLNSVLVLGQTEKKYLNILDLQHREETVNLISTQMSLR